MFAFAFEKKQVDLVAQLVEHLTFNQRVLGSNPSQITKKIAVNRSFDLRLFFVYVMFPYVTFPI